MGSRSPAALLLPLLLLAPSAGIRGPGWTHGLAASRVDKSLAGTCVCAPCHTRLVLPLSTKPWHWPDCWCLHLMSGRQQAWLHLLLQKSRKTYKLEFSRRPRVLASSQRKLLGSCCLSEKSGHLSTPALDFSRRGLRSKRTPPLDPEAGGILPGAGSQRHGGPEFTFDFLPEARAIRVTVPPGPEVSVRLCHQWTLECEELSSPFDAQKVLSGGQTADLPYEFLLPCLCIEASYLQEDTDTVRRKKCPFQSRPDAYASEFWKSARFTDHSQHSQMVMALTLPCPLKPEALLCQRRDSQGPCEDLPNATAQESEGWYTLETVDLHPQLCFKFSFENSSHVECPHRTGSLASWNVSVDTQALQLVLHFSSKMRATFSAAWSRPDAGPDSLLPPVYSVSQNQGSGPVTLDLIIPFLRPGGCVLVWRSDVQFARKHLLCPDVSHRRLGLVTLAALALATLLGVVLVLICRRRLPGRAQRPVLLLHAADSEAQRRLVAALAELLRTALGGGRAVEVDLWEGARVARLGPLPWLWAARARVARERGTALLLWSAGAPGPDPRACLRAAPRPLLLAYFSRLCAKGDIPRPLRQLPRYRLLRDLPRLLRALDPPPGAPRWRSRLELCRRLEREAAQLAAARRDPDCQPARASRLGTGTRTGTGGPPRAPPGPPAPRFPPVPTRPGSPRERGAPGGRTRTVFPCGQS